jgi:translation initiation factor IF-1
LAKEDLIEMGGVVTDVMPSQCYRVELDNDTNAQAYTCGKMGCFRIRIITGDRVKLYISLAI